MERDRILTSPIGGVGSLNHKQQQQYYYQNTLEEDEVDDNCQQQQQQQQYHQQQHKHHRRPFTSSPSFENIHLLSQQQQQQNYSTYHSNQQLQQPLQQIHQSPIISSSSTTTTTTSIPISPPRNNKSTPSTPTSFNNKKMISNTKTPSTSSPSTNSRSLSHSKSISSFPNYYSSVLPATASPMSNNNNYNNSSSSSSNSSPVFLSSITTTTSPLILPSNQIVTPRAKIKKAPSFSGYPHIFKTTKILDYTFIMNYLQCNDTNKVVALELPNFNIQKINNERFELFDKLIYLDLNNNFVQFNQLSLLPNLNELYLSNNLMQNLEFVKGFKTLKILDLSNNIIDSNHLNYLMRIPSLVCLNLSSNRIQTLPKDMSSFSSLETLVLENNQLLQKNTMESLSTIPNLRLLNLNGNQWDRILPINGCFKSLCELSLCYNFISNPLSIGNLYHTSYPLLTRVLLWENQLKSATINFQVGKTIHFITKNPNKQQKQQQQSPMQSPQLQHQQQHLKTPSTYPPKERKKISIKSPSLSNVPSIVGGSSNSYGGSVDFNNQFISGIPSPTKLTNSDPVFFNHNNNTRELLIGQQQQQQFSIPFSPYKPPPNIKLKSPQQHSMDIYNKNRIVFDEYLLCQQHPQQQQQQQQQIYNNIYETCENYPQVSINSLNLENND